MPTGTATSRTVLSVARQVRRLTKAPHPHSKLPKKRPPLVKAEALGSYHQPVGREGGLGGDIEVMLAARSGSRPIQLFLKFFGSAPSKGKIHRSNMLANRAKQIEWTVNQMHHGVAGESLQIGWNRSCARALRTRTIWEGIVCL